MWMGYCIIVSEQRHRTTAAGRWLHSRNGKLVNLVSHVEAAWLSNPLLTNSWSGLLIKVCTVRIFYDISFHSQPEFWTWQIGVWGHTFPMDTFLWCMGSGMPSDKAVKIVSSCDSNLPVVLINPFTARKVFMFMLFYLLLHKVKYNSLF